MGNWFSTEVEIFSVQFKGLEILKEMEKNIITEYPIEIGRNDGLYTKLFYRTKNDVPVDLFFDLSEKYPDTNIRVTFSDYLTDVAGVFEFLNGKGLGEWGKPERNDLTNPWAITNPFRETKFNFNQKEINKSSK